jgi:hypothetical protein
MDDFCDSQDRFELAMAKRLGADFYARDLKHKHKKMAASPFLFLRATCWRWAEMAGQFCPELMAAPAVPSVGDAHAGNFGVWRDAGARLVWGVSDYDEAALLPFTLDLVRLCASLVLGRTKNAPADLAAAALDGYRKGLERPRPYVLERDHLWLRDLVAANDALRADFWKELHDAEPDEPSPGLKAALTAALPDPAPAFTFARRSAGVGSLGRARFVALGDYRAGPVAIEAKAVLPSCWGAAGAADLAARMAAGRWRSADPFLLFGDHYVVRRLGPNSRKIDLAETGSALGLRLVRAMGRELAAVHLGLGETKQAIAADLAARPRGWLDEAAGRVAAWTLGAFESYRKSRRDKD